MTTTFLTSAFFSASFATGAGMVLFDETLTSSQQWTILGLLAAVLGAGWKLLNGIGNRMAEALDKHTDTVATNSNKIGEHTAKVGELVIEIRGLASQHAVKAALLERLDQSIEKIPGSVADELAKRGSQTKA